jgi:hypothetical protein
MELLDYDPVTGHFYWKTSNTGHWRGDVAGSVSVYGYIKITIRGHTVLAHRLAWLFMTGEWPPVGLIVEHRDTIGTNNAWTNLRLANNSQNQANTHGRREGRLKGTRFIKEGVYEAQITKNRKNHYLGRFPTEIAAHAAYRAAAKKHFGEFARAA